MVFIISCFLAPTSGKRKALFLGMKAVGKYDSLHDIVMSVKPDPLCQKYCKVLKRQYSGAVPLAASLIVQYQKKLFQDTPLPERFHETFGAGEEWEKLRCRESKKRVTDCLPGEMQKKRKRVRRM